MNREELEAGAIYHVRARHFYVAVWTGSVFHGPSKVDGIYELVPEGLNDEGYPLGTVYPLRRIGKLLVKPPYNDSNLLAALEALNEEVYERSLDG